MWEFKSGNTFGATAFTSYGAFWLSYAAFVWFFAANLKSEDAAGAIGTYLLVWGIFTFYMWIATLKRARPVMIVFLLLWITFLVLAIGEYQANRSITQIGGYLGILTAIAAWYASARTIINDAWAGRSCPADPIRRRHTGGRSQAGDRSQRRLRFPVGRRAVSGRAAAIRVPCCPP